MYTLVESIADSGKNESEELLASDEESERSIAYYVEDQLRKETTIYEVLMMLNALRANFVLLIILPKNLNRFSTMFFRTSLWQCSQMVAWH